MKQENHYRIHSETILLKYMAQKLKVERENLKKEMQELCTMLVENNVLATIDFKPSGGTLYSEALNQGLSFCQTAGLIITRCAKGAVMYQITPRGLEKANDERSAFYENVSADALKVLDGLLPRFSPGYVPPEIGVKK
jgi:hypothetical protein